jgi:hypothetical protein
LGVFASVLSAFSVSEGGVKTAQKRSLRAFLCLDVKRHVGGLADAIAARFMLQLGVFFWGGRVVNLGGFQMFCFKHLYKDAFV